MVASQISGGVSDQILRISLSGFFSLFNQPLIDAVSVTNRFSTGEIQVSLKFS